MTKVQLIWFELYAVLWEREHRSHQVRHVGIMEIARDDNLGSVTRIFNSAGSVVFSAQYDPWGVQTVTTNTIAFSRGYCGHEMLNGFQLINMNGRLYDPYLGRFLSPDNYVQLPTSAQSFNRYSYCLNNPLKYVDPEGELFFLSSISGFIHGLKRLFHGGKITDPLKYMYKNMLNELKVNFGLFVAKSPLQFLSRFTWEFPQTIAGYYYSNYRLATTYIDHVGYYDGATYVYTYKYKHGFGGVTLGNYINIDSKEPWPRDARGRFDPSKNLLFMHEYGHYLQSQEYGWGYLLSVGIPSLFSAIKDRNWLAVVEDYTYENGSFETSKHITHWYELSANRKAHTYFSRRGMNWDYKQYPLYINKILYYKKRYIN